MLDINLIREKPELVKEDLKKRGLDKPELVDELLNIDKDWRDIKGKLDDLRRQRNELSEKVNKLMKDGKKDDAQPIIQEAKNIPPMIEEEQNRANQLREKINGILMLIPNLLHKSVPVGKDDSENLEVRKWGETKDGKDLKTHAEIAEALGSDFEKSSKIAGHGFYFLRGDLALLNQAIIRYAIDVMVSKGYLYTEPPLMMKKQFVDGVTDLNTFEELIYKVQDEDLYLIATSEHPLISQYSDETLSHKELPLKIAGYSMCFRKEVGTHNVDEKGLFRTHQFNKVEMVVVCSPEDSWKIHEEMIAISEELFKGLEIPYQIVNVCTGDIGNIAAKKYDLNAWYPRQNTYKEVVSCSNCTDYQARRLNIRFDKDGKLQIAHTLNNTAVATSRAMVAILENHQNPDGSVNIPKALQKYMNKNKLEPTKS